MTPVLLRTFLLGSLGVSLHGCSGSVEGRGSVGMSSDGGPTESTACTSPTPLLAGVDTGYFKCAEGYLRRAAIRTCPSHLPRSGTVQWPDGWTALDAGAPDAGDAGAYSSRVDQCQQDSDCVEPNAHCEVVYPATGPCMGFFGAPPVYEPSRLCVAGCRADADCAAGQICVCGDDIGHCAAVSAVAGCRSDADCAGLACLENARIGNFSGSEFACQLASDRCETDGDCPSGQFCSMADTGRSCQGMAVCGRPFLVAHEARLADAFRSTAWLDPDRPSLPAVDPEVARRLAEHWTRIGLMEHASVAAFARFTLQLLGLGAPADLVQAATAAQSDELRHATLAFRLASAYAGSPVGPGPLPLHDALAASSVEDVLRLTIREGCIGETRAALEAGASANTATVPHVKTMLERIAADESQHAALAWRVVKWILARHPELAAIAQQELAVEGPAIPHLVTTSDECPAAHGVLDGAALARVHAMAHHEVIAPCARALLSSIALQPTPMHATA